MLPEHTTLGKLEIFEIYEFYNIPVLFACWSKTGHIYMAVWIDETEDKDTWLYVSLSPQRFMKVRRGEIDLHDAFAKPEDEIVLAVSIYKNYSDVKPIWVEKVAEDWFPLPEDYLDVPGSLPQIVWENLDQGNEQYTNEMSVISLLSIEPRKEEQYDKLLWSGNSMPEEGPKVRIFSKQNLCNSRETNTLICGCSFPVFTSFVRSRSRHHLIQPFVDVGVGRLF